MEDRKRAAIRRRMAKHGLKITCLNCGWWGRTKEIDDYRSARVRELGCPKCTGRVVSLSWAERHQARYQEKVAAEQARLRPVQRSG